MITLRILLVETLRRCAEQIVRSWAARRLADEIADELLGLRGHAQPSPSTSLSRLERARPRPPPRRCSSFQRLRDLDPAVTPALGWLEKYMSAQGMSADETVRLEHQRQATMTVTVRNVITSMRLNSWFDWAEFVESVGLVDQLLRARSSFGDMDFSTRNRHPGPMKRNAAGSCGFTFR